MEKIIIASGPVIVENNKVLLDKQGNDNFWKFCGGKIGENETLEETAIRRSKEELNINAKIANKNPFLMHVKKDITEGTIDVILVHYLAERLGEIIPGEEVSKFNWFDINNLPPDVAPNIIPTLKHFGFMD